MRRLTILFVVCACLAVLLTAGSAPAQRSEDCSWGASSVLVQDVDGRLVQSDPVTTGCVPR